MSEFLQSYGIWVFFALLLGLMVWGRRRGHGMGCCGGQHAPEAVEEEEKPGAGKGGSCCH